jgi:diacylglycerol O-acyltransferase
MLHGPLRVLTSKDAELSWTTGYVRRCLSSTDLVMVIGVAELGDMDDAAPRVVDTPLGWGAREEMNAAEAVMWRVEVDRTLRSTGLVLEELDTLPDWDRFLAAHEWGVRMAARFRQRVVEAPLGLGAPRWTVDPDFDLRFHVRRARLPEGGGWPELLEAAAQVAMTPFDRTRPPWEAVLYEGLPGGRAAYLLKVHHSATDGLSAIQLLEQLHPPTREPNLAKPQPRQTDEQPTSPLGALAGQVRGDVQAVPALAREAGSLALSSLTNPVGALRSATRYGQSLYRVLSPPAAAGSPLLARRSLSWRFTALDIRFADLRAAGKAAGGSVNDAFLAALLGAYRRYHAAMDTPVDSIPMTIPISVRKPDDPPGGTRITAARFAAPVSTADPQARIQQVHALVRAVRSEPALDAVGLISPLMARLPGSLTARITGPLTKANDLQASNIPGISREAYLAGAKIERMYIFGPLPGCAAMITLVSHGETACVAANLDTASFTEPELFEHSLVDGFAEVLALRPGAHPPVRRGGPG